MPTTLIDSLSSAGRIFFGVDYDSGHSNVIYPSNIVASTSDGSRLERSGLFIGSTGTLSYTLASDPFYDGSAQRDVTILCKQRYYRGSATGRIFSIAEKVLFYTYTMSENFRASWDSSATTVKSGGDFKQSENSWVAMTRNGSAATASIYKNGVLSGTANQACGATAGYGTVLHIGNRADGARPFNSNVRCFYIISGILSLSEIQQFQNEVDSINWKTFPGGRIINPDRTIKYDFFADWGVLCSTVNEGGTATTKISNSKAIAGDATGRFQMIREAAGPGGILGKSIKCITGGPVYLMYPNATGTWTYWYYTAATGTWSQSPAIVRSGTTTTIFTMAANDRIFWAADNQTANVYNLRHTP